MHKGDLGILARGRITQGMIHGGTSILSSNVITHVLTESSKMILKCDSLPFKPLKSNTLVIEPQTKPFLSCDRDVRASNEIGDSRPDHGRIGTPFVKTKFGLEMTTSVSEVALAKRINSTLPFSDL